MIGDGKFNPGFRISKFDIFVLVGGAVGTVILCSVIGKIGLVVAFVVGHFFLFCNVFRIARNLEFLWAGAFVAFAGSTVMLHWPSWPITIAAMICTSTIVIVVEIRKPSYHGVGWNVFNPNLRDWWDANVEHEREAPTV